MSRPTFMARTRANPYGVFVVNDFESFQVGTSLGQSVRMAPWVSGVI